MTMAIFLNGMERDEIRDLTLAMIASGERLDFSGLSRRRRTSTRPAASATRSRCRSLPLVASFGVAVPQLSGRGLGHTGGTLDKLESIPGWRASLSNEEFLAQLEDVGAVVCAAGSGLAPADGKLYALRDITGTVEAIPLIASSIMSKKIAEGTGVAGARREVRLGRVPARPRARRANSPRPWCDSATTPASRHGALLTNMNVPLGLAIGNANEVRESVEVLAGGGPADVVELTVALAREMLALAGIPMRTSRAP